jgi:hypothetical protein
MEKANWIALEVRKHAEESGSLIALGIALHSWADTFAHAGFTGVMYDPGNARPGFGFEPQPAWKQARDWAIGESLEIGHSAAGHTPDWPFTDVQKAMEAAKSIYDFLTEFGVRRGYTRYAHAFGGIRTWEEIKGRLEPLFRFDWPSEEERAENWRLTILHDFHEYEYYSKELYEHYYSELIPEFKRWAGEQRRFVMKLYGAE